ncbi:MAG: MFS transporter, partial [Oscillospiraceae bacterium]|nr:MFS transporter [Oscillospiraceae bacterium]
MKKNLTLPYSLHQLAYWAAAAGVMSFAAAFLLEKGFAASQVGVLLACGSVLSGITQPLLAGFADKAQARTGKSILIPMILALTGLSASAFALLLFGGLPRLFFGFLYLVGVWSFDAMMPLLNAIIVYYSGFSYTLNYPLARGVGSLAYSFAALGLGYLIEYMGADWMIYSVLALLALCVAVTLFYPRPAAGAAAAAAPARKSKSPSACSVGQFFLRYRWYCFSLAAVLFLAMFHAMTENYLISIMNRLGGGSRHVGVALFIATASEALVLFFFTHIRARICDHWLLRIAAFSFLLKSVLFLVAPSIPFVYGVQLLQMTSYTFLSPVQVYYAEEKVAPEDMVKGQAF